VPTILIVEDELDLQQILAYNLEHAGYAVRVAGTGREALRLAQEEPPQLVLLDLMLPDMPGTQICKQLKEDPRTQAVPVVMLTARGEESDRVLGFELGADDYVVKPFSVRELLLRTQAILRRHAVPAEDVLAVRELRLDRAAHRVWAEEREIKLTALEFRLLQLLLEERGRVLTRGLLLEKVWNIDAEITTRTVDTHVKRLREKLGSSGDYIETVRGVGYRFLGDE
jgi:two-component system phosphate regulon response regulator PhoB